MTPKQGGYAAYCPELPGCTSAGDTEEEALEDATEGIALYWVIQAGFPLSPQACAILFLAFSAYAAINRNSHLLVPA